MNKKFRIVGASLLFGCLALTAAAQDAPQGPPPDGPGRGGRRAPDAARQVQMMTKKLKLTSDQQAQIKTILTDRVSQMGSIRNDSSLQPKDRREKMMSLMKETNNKVEAILTDKQKKTYKEMEEERRERMQNRQGGGAPPDPQ